MARYRRARKYKSGGGIIGPVVGYGSLAAAVFGLYLAEKRYNVLPDNWTVTQIADDPQLYWKTLTEQFDAAKDRIRGINPELYSEADQRNRVYGDPKWKQVPDFEKLDKNQDGYVSFENFLKAGGLSTDYIPQNIWVNVEQPTEIISDTFMNPDTGQMETVEKEVDRGLPEIDMSRYGRGYLITIRADILEDSIKPMRELLMSRLYPSFDADTKFPYWMQTYTTEQYVGMRTDVPDEILGHPLIGDKPKRRFTEIEFKRNAAAYAQGGSNRELVTMHPHRTDGSGSVLGKLWPAVVTGHEVGHFYDHEVCNSKSLLPSRKDYGYCEEAFADQFAGDILEYLYGDKRIDMNELVLADTLLGWGHIYSYENADGEAVGEDDPDAIKSVSEHKTGLMQAYMMIRAMNKDRTAGEPVRMPLGVSPIPGINYSMIPSEEEQLRVNLAIYDIIAGHQAEQYAESKGYKTDEEKAELIAEFEDVRTSYSREALADVAAKILQNKPELETADPNVYLVLSLMRNINTLDYSVINGLKPRKFPELSTTPVFGDLPSLGEALAAKKGHSGHAGHDHDHPHP